MFAKNVLKQQTALVVGGSNETGPAVCEALARAGANVALTFRSDAKAGAKVATRCRKLGRKAVALRFDLLDREQVFGLVPKVVSSFKRLGILVNLGGPPPDYTHIRKLSEAGFAAMLDGHVKGCFFLAREAARQMAKRGGGVVINVSATSSLKYSHSAYGLAKAAVNEMTKFLAHDLAPTVRVHNIVPGLIDLRTTKRSLIRDRIKASPLKRIVTPEEIGLIVVALATPAFASMTGESLVVDGGFWLKHP